MTCEVTRVLFNDAGSRQNVWAQNEYAAEAGRYCKERIAAHREKPVSVALLAAQIPHGLACVLGEISREWPSEAWARPCVLLSGGMSELKCE